MIGIVFALIIDIVNIVDVKIILNIGVIAIVIISLGVFFGMEVWMLLLEGLD